MAIFDILDNYDVRLVRLSREKIEMIRNWRNDPKISQYMEYRDIITPDMQVKWFDSINNNENLYYIIEFKGEEIGLINIKDIDSDSKSGESGVFMYSDKYLNSDISYRAHLCLFDYYFQTLGYNELHAHVLESNKRASRLSEFLGFKRIDETNYSVYKEDYLSNHNRIRFIRKYTLLKNKKQ